MKRTLILLLLTITIFSNVAYAAEPTDNEDSANSFIPIQSQEYDALKAMNILTDELVDSDANAEISRGQFAGALYRLSGLPEVKNANDIPFIDVNANTPYRDAIAYFYGSGVINGTESNLFMPNDSVTYAQAIKMSVDLLGYKEYVKLKYGEYPMGYIAMAQKLDLTKGIGISSYNDNISAQDIVKLLYNCGLTCVFEATVYGSDGVASYQTDENRYLLSVNSNIFFGKGVMKSNGVVSLTKKEASHTNVIIDDKTYSADELKYTDFLGYEVKYFYKEINGADTVLWLDADNTNSILEIASEDLMPDDGEYSLSRIIYWQNEKRRTAEINKYADVVYNNTLCNNYTIDKIKPKTGFIKLIDNDDDGAYDIVSVTEFDNILVKSVNVDRNLLVGNYYSFSLDNYDTVKIIKDGEDIAINDINSNNLISYVESADKKIIYIYVNKPGVTETLKSTTLSGEEKYTFESGSYSISNSLKKRIEDRTYTLPKLTIGNRYKYYLDMSGNIGAIESATASPYSLLVNAKADDGRFGSGDKAKLRLILSDGSDVTVVTADKLKINEESGKKGSELLNMIQDSSGNGIKRQVVKTVFNKNGELTEIELAQDVNNFSEYGYYKDAFTKDYEANNQIFRSNYLDQLGPKCRLDGNTVCFLVYGDEENPDYKVVSYSHFGNNNRMNVEAYDFDECFTAGAVIIDRSGISSGYRDSFFIVDEVQEVIDDSADEPYLLITGYLNNAYEQFKSKKDGRFPLDIKRGDYMNISTTIEDPEWIEKISKRGSLRTPPEPMIEGSPSDKDKNCYIVGYVYAVNQKAIVTLNPASYTEKLTVTPYKPTLGLKYLVYDAKRDKLYFGHNLEDVRPTNAISGDGSLEITSNSTMVYIRRYNSSIDDLVVALY